MRRLLGAMLAMALVSGPGGPARGDDNDPHAVLDRAIAALGGEAKLRKAEAVAWKARGKSIGDRGESAFTNETTVQGVDRLRMEFEDDVDGERVKGLTVVDGDKGWRRYGESAGPLDADRLANHKRNLYLLVVPVTLVPLKGKDFRIERAGEEQV